MNTTFTLDPEYQNFAAGLSTLKPGTVGANGCLAALSVVSIVMSLGMLVFLHVLFNSFEQEMELFRTQGVETTAQVVSCEMTTSKSYGSIPRLTYAYSWNGTAYQDSEAIYERNQDCAPYLNQTVDIRVVTSKPDMSRLIMEEAPDSDTLDNTPLTLLDVLMGGISVFYLIPLVIYRRNKRRYARLVENGSVLEGEIIKVSGATASKSSNYIVTVQYQFQSPEGELLKGRTRHHRQDLKGNLPAVGTPVRVLYADRSAHVML